MVDESVQYETCSVKKEYNCNHSKDVSANCPQSYSSLFYSDKTLFG